jgi:DNA mismatch repair ATPase MutS
MNVIFADNNTLKDLEIFEDKEKKSGLLLCFKNTLTQGGYNKIQELLSNPTDNINNLLDRQNLIKYLSNSDNLNLDFSKEDIGFIESYLNSDVRTANSYFKIAFYVKALLYRIIFRNHYEYIIIGVAKIIRFIHQLNLLLDSDYDEKIVELKIISDNIKETLEKKNFKKILRINPSKHLSLFKTLSLDSKFRLIFKPKFELLLNQVYLLDAFSTIGRVSKESGFCFPEFINDDTSQLVMKDFFHPMIEDPVKNSIKLISNNTIFLTGPNMSGKTTLLKAIGISVYLAHLGFPVPCSSMLLTPFKSIITSIDNNDNINIGYSYFYAEVKRVKEAIERIKNHKNVLWIADELFRGTNIKDAYDASELIIKSVSKAKGNVIISSHLIELSKDIEHIPTITFKQMETQIVNDLPKFAYKLIDGVSSVRLGLYILKKEKVIDNLDEMLDAGI